MNVPPATTDSEALRQNASLRTLLHAQEEELKILREKSRADWVASKTLDSEREANARLTLEVEEARAQFDTHVAWASDQMKMIEAQVDALGEALYLLSGPLRAVGFLETDEHHRLYENVVAAYREIGWGGDEK